MIILMYSFTFETKASKFVKSSLGFSDIDEKLIDVKKDQTNTDEQYDEMFVDTEYHRMSRPETLPDVWITSPFEYKNYQSTDDYNKYFSDLTNNDHIESLRSKVGPTSQARIPDHELLTE